MTLALYIAIAVTVAIFACFILGYLDIEIDHYTVVGLLLISITWPTLILILPTCVSFKLGKYLGKRKEKK